MNKAKVIAFLSLEALLYICFLYCDITDRFIDISPWIKYAAILICASVAILTNVTQYNSERRLSSGKILLAAAMIFTAISDRFLLFGDDFLPGIISFCIVQTVYLTVIEGALVKRVVIALFIRASLCTIAVSLLSGNIQDDLVLIAVAAFYGISFVGNILRLFINEVFGKKTGTCMFGMPVLFLVGMICFLLCDINVLIYNLGSFIEIDSSVFMNLSSAASVLMWAFYLPSQVMIVLSA